MAKLKKHNLSFTEEEATGKKAEKLKEDIKKAKVKPKPKKEMMVKRNLKFEEDKPKPSSRFIDNAKDSVKDTPRKIVSGKAHEKAENDSDENVSVEAADKGTKLTEESVHSVRTYERRRNRKVTDESTKATREERAARRQEERDAKAEAKADRKEINSRYAEYKEANAEGKSNPYSRWKQKQEIKKEYYAAKHGTSSAANATASSAAETVKSKAKDTTEKIGHKAVEALKDNKVILLVGGGIVLALIIGMSMLGSSGGALVSSGGGAISATTYPSEDSEMIAADDYYTSLETQLQSTISNYEATHSYDEYHYSLDPIGHDPYELTSLLTAEEGDAYQANQVQGVMMNVYNKQYSLTQRVVRETRYRYETRVRQVTYVDADGNTHTGFETYTVRVPYDYYICYVTLRNNGIDAAASSLLTAEQQEMYAIYNETKGNREDLF